MAGHSKWKNIQRTKGAQDAKRGKVFTKIAREIIVAVKEGGGGDPSKNSRLAAAIAKAKAANMPNDNIKRTIDRAVGTGSGDSYESVTYEGYGPRGVAVIVEAMTDNRNRIAAEVRLWFDKYGGNLGTTGCVSWSFDRKGILIIDNEDGKLDEDAVFNDALEAGADDIEIDEGIFEISTTPEAFSTVSGVLESLGYNFLSAQIEMVPQTYVTLDDPTDIKNMEKMLELMEDSDDVQDVWHNAVF
ncbi:MAG: YebC/PmpR family DNA-binding transcriptional regulator [Oscillospiraceae bacterium]|jgi:YebC/PmpR family DNA-binding regulatory protein|nr:YebC/PmpR family DNA-binding transcriptional regulator [Oscillospiraceae bacterium]